jgi:NTP pyrophosphatase (non-canonical NTP hydrolase)
VTLNELATQIHEINVAHGWDFDAESDTEFATKIALVHAELSEALEERRDHAPDRVENGKPEGVGPELADVLIRTLHLMHKLGVDIDETVSLKVQFNRTRTFRHGRAF